MIDDELMFSCGLFYISTHTEVRAPETFIRTSRPDWESAILGVLLEFPVP